MLPTDIRFFNLTLAPLGKPNQPEGVFHATSSAVGKLYIYRFCTNDFVEPMKRNYCTHFYRPMDMDLFEKCLNIFVGTHDFRAFGNKIEHTEKSFESKQNVEFSTIRTVNSINLIGEGGGHYRIEFRIESAIYRMIRNIVGTSLHVATGDMEFDHLQYLLSVAPYRIDNKAKSAAPHGLTLDHVYYDHY